MCSVCNIGGKWFQIPTGLFLSFPAKAFAFFCCLCLLFAPQDAPSCVLGCAILFLYHQCSKPKWNSLSSWFERVCRYPHSLQHDTGNSTYRAWLNFWCLITYCSLGFKQYAGYINVNPATGRNLFYWFVESQNAPATDPVLLVCTRSAQPQTKKFCNVTHSSTSISECSALCNFLVVEWWTRMLFFGWLFWGIGSFLSQCWWNVC